MGAVLCMWRASELGTAKSAEGALKAVEEAMAVVNNHKELKSLIDNCSELQRRSPGFKVQLKAGLQSGWVIEGAVGSSHKIDASYLSPHVNMTARIETATFQYGVEIMVSEVLYKLLSTETQRRMRNLDKVLVKGSEQPMMLWSPSLGELDGDGGNKFNRFTANYCSAVDSYCQGAWPAAFDALQECLQKFPGDQAAKTLLDYMHSAKSSEDAGRPVAPTDWAGSRKLTIK